MASKFVLCTFGFLSLGVSSVEAIGQSASTTSNNDAVTIAANFDGGYHKTQFFAPSYNTGVAQWDSRLEWWLPPTRDKFSWGPYVRIAGIAGSQSDAWQNEWIAIPGAGFQVFPFSSWRFQGNDSRTGKILGPVRAFGEYNFAHFWGRTNVWRPRNQAVAGFDYWKAMNVNSVESAWWTEIWNGLYWKSSNEFTDRYDSVIFANSIRLGIRRRQSGSLSLWTPYLLMQSSKTKYGAGRRDYYWENNLEGGGGFRFAPSLRPPKDRPRGLNRFVVYAEYLNTATYYGPKAPSSVPRYDIRFGVSASIGDWYK